MSISYLRTPLVSTLPVAVRTQLADALQLEGKALPCHVISAAGPLITVAFDLAPSVFTLPQITVPLFGPQYVRYPIQPGDQGYVIPVACPVGFSSGQASSPADLSQPGNLEALVFMPIGNAQWATVNPNAVVVYGPDGVELRDTASGSVITLLPGSITMTTGSCSFSMSGDTITLQAPAIVLDGQLTQGTESGGYPATLQGPVTVVNDVTAAGTSVHTHEHSGVQSGSDNSGPPV